MHKYMHIRRVDENGAIMSTGGITIAWTGNESLDGIFVHYAECSVRDQYSRKIGRQLASKRLFEDGPVDIIPFNHPISESIRLWIQQWFDIYLMQDEKKRWVADFYTPNIEADEFVLPEPIYEDT